MTKITLYTVVNIIYIAFGAIIGLLSTFPLYIEGVISDEFTTESSLADKTSNGLSVVLIFLTIVIIALDIIKVVKKKSIGDILIIFSFVILIVSFVLSIRSTNKYMLLSAKYNLTGYSESQKEHPLFQSTITLDELLQIKEEKNSALIYFERADCPTCIAITEDLHQYFDQFGILLYQYNTLDDREDNREKLDKVLELYSVTSVPSIVELNNGEVVEIYEEEDILAVLYPED